jgi:hypothetical protein
MVSRPNSAGGTSATPELLSEGEMRLEGVLVFGSLAADTLADYRNVRCAVSETATLCLPLALTSSRRCAGTPVPSPSDAPSLTECWAHKDLQNLPSILRASQNDSSDAALLSVVEQCMCMDVSSAHHAVALKTAINKRALQEHQQAEAGPRSIAQVRKDRDKERDKDGASTPALSVMTGVDQVDGEDSTVDIDFEDAPTNRILTPGVDAQGELLRDDDTNAVTLRQLLRRDAQKGRVSLIVLYSCGFRGSVRFGTCFLHSVRVLQPAAQISFAAQAGLGSATPAAPAPPAFSDKAYSEFLQIQCMHQQKMTLAVCKRREIGNIESDSAHDDTWNRSHCHVPVQLQLRNLRDEKATVTIEALDRRAEQSPRKPSTRGLRWDRKTKFCNVPVPAGGCSSLNFHALISRPGVFDLKR